MNHQDFQIIERELGIALPEAYCEFQLTRDAATIDSTTIANDSRLIIERTLQYRQGCFGAPPWPDDAVYVGDEDDACPYVLFCSTGKVIQSDHGNFNTKPLSTYLNFKRFVESLKNQDKDDSETAVTCYPTFRACNRLCTLALWGWVLFVIVGIGLSICKWIGCNFAQSVDPLGVVISLILLGVMGIFLFRRQSVLMKILKIGSCKKDKQNGQQET